MAIQGLIYIHNAWIGNMLFSHGQTLKNLLSVHVHIGRKLKYHMSMKP